MRLRILSMAILSLSALSAYSLNASPLSCGTTVVERWSYWGESCGAVFLNLREEGQLIDLACMETEDPSACRSQLSEAALVPLIKWNEPEVESRILWCWGPRMEHRYKCSFEVPVFCDSEIEWTRWSNERGVSCEENCASPKWDLENRQVGQCSFAMNAISGKYVPCHSKAEELGSEHLICGCSEDRDLSVHWGNQGQISCDEFCSQRSKKCVSAWDAVHEQPRACDEVIGRLGGRSLLCSCK